MAAFWSRISQAFIRCCSYIYTTCFTSNHGTPSTWIWNAQQCFKKAWWNYGNRNWDTKVRMLMWHVNVALMLSVGFGKLFCRYSSNFCVILFYPSYLKSLSSIEAMRNVSELLGDMLQAINPSDRMVCSLSLCWKELSIEINQMFGEV